MYLWDGELQRMGQGITTLYADRLLYTMLQPSHSQGITKTMDSFPGKLL